MTRRAICAVVLLGLLSSMASAQRRPAAADEEQQAVKPDSELMTKVYRVKDLVLPTPNYSFDGVQLPGAAQPARPFMGGGGMGGFGNLGGMGGGGFGAGGGGTSGGGFFDVAPGNVLNQVGGGEPAQQPHAFVTGDEFQIDMDDLIDTIQATVEPESWEDVGGRGTIASLGGLLVVQQTPQVHAKLSELLDALRNSGAVAQSITIRAMWLSGENDSILSFKNRVPRQISPEQLAELSNKVVARGQITCFDSQTVHIIAGELRSAVTSYIPVVGQSEVRSDSAVAHSTADGSKPASIPATVLAQTAGGGIVSEREASVGYQPVTQTMNLGMLLQVTPLLLAEGQSVAVDVHSIVVSPTREPVQVDFKTGMKLDRIDLSTQQFKTTLRMPLNQPTVVSGMTMQPTSSDKDQQLILVLEVFAN